MPISIYNYSDTKLPLAIELNGFLSTLIGEDKYYIDSDWEHGPSTLVVFDETIDEKLVLNDLEAYVASYFEVNPISEDLIEGKKKKYQLSQNSLMTLEKRISHEALMANHGEVLIRKKKVGLYNSSEHEQMFSRYRRALNPLYVKLARHFHVFNESQKLELIYKMFQFIATLFEDGPQIGYLSFLSHAQGFFSRMKANKGIEDLYVRFEKKRLLMVAQFEGVPDEALHDFDLWKTKWEDIVHEMNQNFDWKFYKGDVRFDLSDQHKLLEDNISNLENSFHKNLLEFHKETDLLGQKKIVVYRDIVNLFYLSLPIFEQSMLKKQFFAFCTARYYEEEYGKAFNLGFDLPIVEENYGH